MIELPFSWASITCKEDGRVSECIPINSRILNTTKLSTFLIFLPLLLGKNIFWFLRYDVYLVFEISKGLLLDLLLVVTLHLILSQSMLTQERKIFAYEDLEKNYTNCDYKSVSTS